MASYNREFKPSVEKDLNVLPKVMLARVMTRIESLAADPLPPNSLKLAGAERLYRIRIGDYRVVYEVVAAAKQVLVHHVRRRREAYRGL
jgi:mRNA interferase RelE/StbE